jgi:hypothetical protein
MVDLQHRSPLGRWPGRKTPDTGIDVMYTHTRRGTSISFEVDMFSVMRPFESKYFQTTRGRPQKEEKPDEEAVFVLEASARVQVTTLEGLGWKYKWESDDDDEDDDDADAEEDEVTRVTRTKRVYNPSDSSQYVDVEIIDAIVFKDKYNRSVRMNLTNL